MELKKNTNDIDAKTIEEMVEKAIKLATPTTNLVAIFRADKETREPHTRQYKGVRVFIPRDIVHPLFAKFKSYGYYVWYYTDYEGKTDYWVTERHIRPHSWYCEM